MHRFRHISCAEAVLLYTFDSPLSFRLNEVNGDIDETKRIE